MSNIAPINKGIQVLEKGTNFLSGIFLRWLQSVESKLNRAVVTDENGNIAYGGAVIPDDVSDEYIHHFYDGLHVDFVGAFNIRVHAYNCYVNKTGDLVRLDTSKFVHIQQYRPDTKKLERFVAGSGVGAITFTKIYEQDDSGNINIKTGSTYTATL